MIFLRSSYGQTKMTKYSNDIEVIIEMVCEVLSPKTGLSKHKYPEMRNSRQL